MIKYKHKPIHILPGGLCPKCRRNTITIAEMETNYYHLDQVGNGQHQCAILRRYSAYCPCGYSSLNWRPINGRFKYLSEFDMMLHEDSICNSDNIELDIINIVDDPRERTFTGNPFTIKE